MRNRLVRHSPMINCVSHRWIKIEEMQFEIAQWKCRTIARSVLKLWTEILSSVLKQRCLRFVQNETTHSQALGQTIAGVSFCIFIVVINKRPRGTFVFVVMLSILHIKVSLSNKNTARQHHPRYYIEKQRKPHQTAMNSLEALELLNERYGSF